MMNKIFNKLVIFILIFFTINSYSNVIYDKKDVIISELDLIYYKQLYFQKFENQINSSQALKDLVKIKKLIKNLKKNNPEFIEKIDKIIFQGIKEDDLRSQTILDILRFFNTRNEFVYNYYNNYFEKSDLEIIFSNLEKLELPISKNNCLTIVKLIDFHDNSEFINIFFKNFKVQKDNYDIFIDDEKYSVCIDTRSSKMIEKEIFKYIESKIQNDFEKFVYEKQNR